MLELNQIVKEYVTGDSSVTALKGVSIRFRENEFVSILGPSGCGKTTLLNIIGGLDKYTSGDLVINGVSTKQYRDCDWDSYRNHSIGFVFQSYNLIPHQTVLANVELALTLSGVSKKERRRRATEALELVGLGDQLKKKPNQMSGGQMQRVAIARALVNNPDILLADEPTGALDTATSEQVMEILANVARDRLVIMVTHNPDIAERYSTRIVKLLDGNVISDSMPVEEEDGTAVEQAPAETDASGASAKTGKAGKKGKNRKDAVKRPPRTSMSFFTALALSLNNLLTKKARTILTAFAGSIGIIGIALILSLSNGVQLYIDSVEEDTLSSYPLTIEKTTIDITSFASAMQNRREGEDRVEDGNIYTYNVMTGFMELMLKEVASNDLSAFKRYIENNADRFEELTSDIQYSYSTPINIYRGNLDEGVFQVNPGQVFSNFGMRGGMSSRYMSTDVWQRLIDNDRLLNEQYEVLCGRMPEKYNEVALIVSNDFEVTDYTLYSLGVLDPDELTENFTKMAMGEEVELAKERSYSYDELLGLTFRLLINTDYFERQGEIWVDKSEDEVYLLNRLENSPEIRITCILRSDSDAAQSSMAGIIGYRTELMEFLIDSVNKSDIVTSQKNSPDIDIFTGIPFERDDSENEKLTMEQLELYITTLPADEQEMCRQSIESMRGYGMDDERILEAFAASMERETTDATYEDNLRRMGVSDPESPSAINIFPKDFESKDRIADLINEYNDEVGDEGRITYTDYVGLIMSSVTTIINAISYILIAFVAISLVVSSIMIGIITYISVLERTKEIGILRAIGASKTDISRVFNAETLIVGFTAGAMGIIISFLLLIPINAIIEHITDIAGIAVLPAQGAVILVLISMFLTFIAGLIPSGFAARKDPVVALRTE